MGSLIMGSNRDGPGSSVDRFVRRPWNAGSGPLFWIYVDKPGPLVPAQRKATRPTHSSALRAEALAFIRSAWRAARPAACSSKRTTAKVVLEQHAALSTSSHEPSGNGTADGMPVAAANPAAEGRAMNLGRRLEWAHQLRSAARVSPSRIGLLCSLAPRNVVIGGPTHLRD
mgnify:CR=1 FL=1